MARRKTDGTSKTAGGPLTTSPAPGPTVTDSDVARRAYDLYLARRCEHGRDLDDWLQAEAELQTKSSIA